MASVHPVRQYGGTEGLEVGGEGMCYTSSGGGVAAYTNTATTKALNAYLQINALSTANASSFTYSGWLKTAGGGGMRLFNHDPAVNANVWCEFLNGSPALITTSWADLNYDSQFSVESLGPARPASSDWQHVLMSVDTNHASGARLFACYVDDTLTSDTILQDYGSAFSMPFSGIQFDMPDTEAGNPAGDWFDLQFWHGVSILSGNSISQANRRLFIDGSGNPVDPATAVASLGARTVFLSGSASSFVVNGGTGGSIVVNGSFSNAATSPTD